MKRLVLNESFTNAETGERREYGLTFSKIPADNGRHVTQAVLTNGSTFLICEHARLGVRDAKRNRYNFWAGSRIAFDRVIERLKAIESDHDLVREVRRGFQLSLALEENKAAIEETTSKLLSLLAQREGLEARATEDSTLVYIVEQALALGPLPDIRKNGETLRKPDAYKARYESNGSGPAGLPDTWAPHGQGTPEGYYLKASPECSECQDPDVECCRRHGGVA